jgi:TolA-binding protein
MRSIERRQLKEDEFITTLQETLSRIDEHRQQMLWAAAALVVIGLVVAGYSWRRQQTTAKSSALLADAMAVAEAPVAPATPPPAEGTANASATPTPPPPPAGSFPNERARLEAALKKYMVAADAYPTSPAGIAARYSAAAALTDLGRLPEAAQQYQQVIDKGGSSIHGRMARLGLAEVQTELGKYDPAIATFKELAASAKDLPIDGILMQLGRTYVAAGRTVEAKQTFKRLTDEFPTSPYVGDARQQLDAL